MNLEREKAFYYLVKFKFSLSLNYMELKVVIDKKFAFMILGGILILAGAIYGYAQSGVPNPGHDWNEIGNVPADLADGDADSFGEITGVQAKISSGLTSCAGSNKAIKTINPTTGAVTCETDDVGGGTFSCNTKSTGNGGDTQKATCSSGYFVTGGGCSGSGSSYPVGNNAWECDFGDGSGSAYARCCKIS